MTAKKWAGSYSLFETFTSTGQRVEFDAAPKDGEEITSAINKAKSVYSGCPTKFVEHGAKSSATRYDITRHEYGGGDDESGGGYIELLEINNAPNARWHIVIHSYAYQSVGGIERSFSEWDSVESARKAFKFGHSFKKETLEKRKGFRRYVECSELTPWFYAIGEEPLLGDFAIHAGFEAHPVYRFGRKFLIQSEEGHSKVVTCMGSSKYSYVSEHFLGPKSTDFSWVIMFSDGSHIHIGPDDKIAEKEIFSFEKRTISPIPDGEV